MDNEAMNQKSIVISDQNPSRSPGLRTPVPEYARSQHAQRRHRGLTQKNPTPAQHPKEQADAKTDRCQNLTGML